MQSIRRSTVTILTFPCLSSAKILFSFWFFVALHWRRFEDGEFCVVEENGKVFAEIQKYKRKEKQGYKGIGFACKPNACSERTRSFYGICVMAILMTAA